MAVGLDTVTIYTTSTCPWCTRAKQFLQQKGVPFQERNLEHDSGAAQEVRIGLRVKDGPGGAVVGTVHPGTPAERAGLRQGDIVVEIDGRAVRSAADLEAALASLTSGQTVAVDVRRDGRPIRLRLQI